MAASGRTLMALLLLAGCGAEEATPPAPAPARPAPVAKAAPAASAPRDDVAPRPAPPAPSSGDAPPPRPDAPPAPDYRAIGTEPFWAVTIRETVASLERPDHSPMRFHVRRAADDRSIRYQGDGFSLTATEGPCSDGMSDAVWSDRVQIAFAGGTLKGCGGEREDP